MDLVKSYILFYNRYFKLWYKLINEMKISFNIKFILKMEKIYFYEKKKIVQDRNFLVDFLRIKKTIINWSSIKTVIILNIFFISKKPIKKSIFYLQQASPSHKNNSFSLSIIFVICIYFIN